MKLLHHTWRDRCALVAAVAAFGVSTANAIGQGTSWIKGMAPNWEQPYDYPDLFDPSGPGPWFPGALFSAWCTPTSAAMCMGHWEGRLNRHGIADGFSDCNQGVVGGYCGMPWGAGPSWHDYTADGLGPGPHPLRGVGVRPVEDIGWYMDTNNIGDPAFMNPWHMGTYYKDVAPGIINYLNAVGAAPGQPGEQITAVTIGVDPVFGGLPWPQLAQIASIEIDLNRTVIAHYAYWNPLGPPGPGNGNGSETEEYQFGYSDYTWGPWTPVGANGEEYNDQTDYEGLGHSVLIVAYSDDAQGNVTHFIQHDNWPTTVRNVRLPAGPQLVAITLVGGWPNLGVPTLSAGQKSRFELWAAGPNAPAYLAYSTKGLGATFVPQLGVTLNLKSPKQAGSMTKTNAVGYASWQLTIPKNTRGMNVWFEAAQVGLDSNTVPRRIQ